MKITSIQNTLPSPPMIPSKRILNDLEAIRKLSKDQNPYLHAAAMPMQPLYRPNPDMNARIIELSTLYANSGQLVKLSLAMFDRYA